jgi:hypothetical protein
LVGIFSHIPPIFFDPPPLFTLTALVPLIPKWARFSLYYFTQYMSLSFRRPYVHSRFWLGAFWVPYLGVTGAASCERCLCLLNFIIVFFCRIKVIYRLALPNERFRILLH